MLNTSAGAGARRLLPRLVITGTDLPGRVAGPGPERPPVGDCDAWRPRPRHVGPSACRVADGRAGGRPSIRLRGRGCTGCNESGWLPGRARGVTDDAEVQRVPRSCGAGRAPLAGSGDDAPDATGCSRMHRDGSRRMMMQATQRNLLHHRCIRSRRTVKSQVTAATRRPGSPRAPQGHMLRRRQCSRNLPNDAADATLLILTHGSSRSSTRRMRFSSTRTQT